MGYNRGQNRKSLLYWKAVTYILVRGDAQLTNKLYYNMSGGVSSTKTGKGDREFHVLECVYTRAVLPRVKGSLSDEVTFG